MKKKLIISAFVVSVLTVSLPSAQALTDGSDFSFHADGVIEPVPPIDGNSSGGFGGHFYRALLAWWGSF